MEGDLLNYVVIVVRKRVKYFIAFKLQNLNTFYFSVVIIRDFSTVG